MSTVNYQLLSVEERMEQVMELLRKAALIIDSGKHENPESCLAVICQVGHKKVSAEQSKKVRFEYMHGRTEVINKLMEDQLNPKNDTSNWGKMVKYSMVTGMLNGSKNPEQEFDGFFSKYGIKPNGE